MPGQEQKHLIEDYLAECWQKPMCRFLKAREVRGIRPNFDPPDVDFHVIHQDARKYVTWGEITCTFYNNKEAKWIRGEEVVDSSFCYFQPDKKIGEFVTNILEGKLKKYDALVEARGKGHLLLFLNSPLTTRSTRLLAEQSIIDAIRNNQSFNFPFESVWLSYRIPETSRDEMELSSFCFRDEEGQLNFFKPAWSDCCP